MSGPIVRTGTTPKFWENWDKAFGKGKKAAKSTAAKSTAGKSTAANPAAKATAKKAKAKTPGKKS